MEVALSTVTLIFTYNATRRHRPEGRDLVVPCRCDLMWLLRLAVTVFSEPLIKRNERSAVSRVVVIEEQLVHGSDFDSSANKNRPFSDNLIVLTPP